ncbi:MAG: hypothetical protein NT062_25070 [Proteobacteria bacterium]|nr:hypothetical protein [Pseudomonadota bacterium]
MKLHELVFSARTAGRNAEAICLAQNNVNATNGWLVGASHFETSQAWESLGCHELAVSEIEAALHRPRDRSWKDTCDWCAQIHGECTQCSEASALIPCPSNGQLVGAVGPKMLSQAPSDASWNDPSIALCTPIELPQPGWYVVGHVHQDIPERYFIFHLALDAQTSRVVAASEGEQRSMHEVCEVRLGAVTNHAGSPSSVTTREDCVDKMERASSRNFEAAIAPPQVVIRPR